MVYIWKSFNRKWFKWLLAPQSSFSTHARPLSVSFILIMSRPKVFFFPSWTHRFWTKRTVCEVEIKKWIDKYWIETKRSERKELAARPWWMEMSCNFLHWISSKHYYINLVTICSDPQKSCLNFNELGWNRLGGFKIGAFEFHRGFFIAQYHSRPEELWKWSEKRACIEMKTLH